MSTIQRFLAAVAIVFVVLVLGVPHASAKTPQIVNIPLRMGIGLENFYVSNAGGSVSCNGGTQSSQAPSFFNTAGNWSNPKVAGKIGPADTVFLCGTLQASAGAINFLACQGNGSAGSPITIKFDTNAVVQAPYFGAPGNSCSGHSWIVIDGGTNGKIQNTANGDLLANQQFTQLLNAENDSNVTIQNLELANAYVHIQGTQEKVDHQQEVALYWNGSNLTMQNVYVHDCGWCVNDFYGNDSNVTYKNNHWDEFEHGLAIFDQGGSNASGYYLINNHFGNMNNWDCGTTGGIPNCHHDPVHIFANVGDGSSIGEIYIGNNLWDGNVGCCMTDEIFIEGGASPANVTTLYVWNNVFQVVSTCNPSDPSGECPSIGREINTQGWVGLFSSTIRAVIANNTVYGLDAFGTTNCSGPACQDPCFGVGAALSVGLAATNPVVVGSPTVFNLVSNYNLQTGSVVQITGATGSWAAFNGLQAITFISATSFSIPINSTGFSGSFNGTIQTTMPSIFKNNVLIGCGEAITTDNAVTVASTNANWDYNYYGQACYPLQSDDQCFTYNGNFNQHWFGDWQTNTGGWDTNGLSAQPMEHSAYSANSTLFNANGSPQSGSPIIGVGANLTSLASSYPGMASITSDTTAGGTRSASSRPSSGNWDMGAFQFSSSPPPSNPARVLITWTN